MDSIRIGVSGDRQVGLRFDEFPDALRAELRATIDELANELFALIQAKTPDRTGKLMADEGVKLFDDGDKISGKVYVLARTKNEAVKAISLEYGAHGPVEVQSYLRGGDQRTSLARLFGAPHDNMVKAYTRGADVAWNIDEHAFERGPIAEMAPVIAVRLNAVVENATQVASA